MNRDQYNNDYRPPPPATDSPYSQQQPQHNNSNSFQQCHSTNNSNEVQENNNYRSIGLDEREKRYSKKYHRELRIITTQLKLNYWKTEHMNL
jgi:hypothetical protein